MLTMDWDRFRREFAAAEAFAFAASLRHEHYCIVQESRGTSPLSDWKRDRLAELERAPAVIEEPWYRNQLLCDAKYELPWPGDNVGETR